MKPDPALSRPENYPFHINIEPRYGDMDINAHLNNVAIARYFEESRVRFQMLCYGEAVYAPGARQHFKLVIAQSRIDYLSQGNYPATLDCGVGLLKFGNTSYTLLSAIWQRQQCIAIQQSVMVILGEHGPLSLSQPERALMMQHMMRSVSGAAS